MSKKKAGKPPVKKKEGQLVSVAGLLRQYPDLDREEAEEIVASGLDYEGWQQKKEQEREARRQANRTRMIALVRFQHPVLSEEDAIQIIDHGLTPEQYIIEKEEAARRKIEEESRQRLLAYRAKRQQELAEQQAQQASKKPRAAGPKLNKSKGKGGKKKFTKPTKDPERQRQIEEMIAAHPELSRPLAGHLLSQGVSYEEYVRIREEKAKRQHGITRDPEQYAHAQALKEARRQALRERISQISHLGVTGESFLCAWRDAQTPVVVMRFHLPDFRGRIVGDLQPFVFEFQYEKQRMLLRKLNCALLFEQSAQPVIFSQMLVDLRQAGLRQYPHREYSRRYVIPEAHLAPKQEISVLLHNGFWLCGWVLWADRFQFLLHLEQGGEVFIFVHSVAASHVGCVPPEGPALSYDAFLSTNPELPESHPSEIVIDNIFVPLHFADYPVEDERYDRLKQGIEAGAYQMTPLQVRREGTDYVLMDGYRRLVLARELSFPTVPIRVV